MNLPDGLDEDRLAAAVSLVGRTGAADVEFGYANDTAPTVADADWWATARYRGARVMVEHHPGPLEALEALAARLLHGAKCLGCGRVIAIHDGPIPVSVSARYADGTGLDLEQAKRVGPCRWARDGAVWVRGCGESAPDGSTRERLARAMAEAGVPSEAIRLARAGRYDDYLSEDPHAVLSLVADLEKNGFPDLAARARAGEFDGTAEEADAWADTPEGRAAHAELMPDGVPTGLLAEAVKAVEALAGMPAAVTDALGGHVVARRIGDPLEVDRTRRDVEAACRQHGLDPGAILDGMAARPYSTPVPGARPTGRNGPRRARRKGGKR